MTFVDSSALYALVDPDDEEHARAMDWLEMHKGELLSSHSYVATETIALAGRRLDRTASQVLLDMYLPSISILYVDADLHARAVAGYRAALGRKKSFVDQVSFQMMRDRSITTAFTFDRDFAREGFSVVP